VTPLQTAVVFANVSADLGLIHSSRSDEEIDSDPRLALAAAWVCFYGGDAIGARRFIAAAGPTEGGRMRGS